MPVRVCGVGRMSARAALIISRYLHTVLWLVRNSDAVSDSLLPFFMWTSASRRAWRTASLQRFPGSDARV